VPNADSPAWYFAYGSNLWIDQMVERVGAGCLETPPEVARLPDYRLVFNMRGDDGAVFANIATPGDGVYGVIYRCSSAVLARLDEFESGYDRVWMQVIDRVGLARSAVAYVAHARPTGETGLPSEPYVRRILTGARQQGLPEEYIRRIESLAAASKASGGRQPVED